METLTDREKQALTEILEDYIDNLLDLGYTEATINIHRAIAFKLGLSLFDYHD
jgi:FixJ family two-component response regulator